MERLYTSITNKEQNNNYLQTGRTGEREDFMRENLFMTETFEAPVRIALDHGWSSIKGEHTFMETSVVPVEYTPLTNHGLLEYKGKKYIVGQGRLGKQATKTENENYFLLTLAGIAKELKYQGKAQAEHVELYAGVPLTLFGAERKEFRDYLWHKHLNGGGDFCSVYYEVKEAVRELLDLKFKILPALEDVACGKKRRRKSGKDGES